MARLTRWRRRVRGDGALIGMTDAVITLIILGIASFVLWRASLAPVQAAEQTVWEVESSQVSALATGLLRVTVPQTEIWLSPETELRLVGRTVGSLLSDMHRHVYAPECQGASCPAIGGKNHCPNEPGDIACDVVRAGQRIHAEARAMSSDRWGLRIEVADRGTERFLCVLQMDEADDESPVTVRASACGSPGTTEVIAQDALIPRYGSLAEPLQARFLAFRNG